MSEADPNLPPRPRTIHVGNEQLSQETPTQSLIQASSQTLSAVDKRGRVIVVARITALQLYRLTKIMKENASNSASMDLAVIAASVREINGDPVIFPTSEAQLEFIFQRLDFDGLEAVGQAFKHLNAENAEDTSVDVPKN